MTSSARPLFLRQPAEARAFTSRRARGDYVQLLDADDILEADKLKVQVEFLQRHPDTDIVLGEAAGSRDGD